MIPTTHRSSPLNPTAAVRSGLALLLLVVLSTALSAQPRRPGSEGRGDGNGDPLPSIADKTDGMESIDGFFPLFWDDEQGRMYMEIGRLDVEVLHVNGLGAGLGSNDIGIDRGQLAGSRIVHFERVGRKVLMVQPNYRFRASSDNAAEVRAVRDSFARSVLWGFTAAAENDDAVLVDLTDFLVRDATHIARRMSPGTYTLDASRSSVYRPMTMGFPQNTELEVELTFVRQPGGAGGGGSFGGFSGFGGGAFEGVGNVAASREAASVRLHHSFVQLPDDAYRPRRYDPRAGYGAMTYQDYSAALGEPMTQRFIRRHRLEKRNPLAAMSDPVEPIVYYLDPGTPEPIRSALLDGARWWNQAFEAAGYRDAFQVQLRPEGVSPLDIRYNVINWVHRSTRGWSTGGSVSDPRTGEIIKGVVTLGSLRIRQDYLIAEGLLSPYVNGDETPPELAAWALARLRQLSAHEVGHTLGLSHNYYDSSAGRISVMDYPHPLITLRDDGTFDVSEVYDVDIGSWDKVAITWGYQDFPDGGDTPRALAAILDDSWNDDVRFLTNQDIATHSRADQWSNGTDAGQELERMMEVRRVALSRFGENAIKRGMPLATMEETLVPLYLHHRYQVEAAASAVGGLEYIYALRGDGRNPVSPVPAAQQFAALRALTSTLDPSALALPRSVLDRLPPRPAGYRRHRELFPRYTGGMFDAISPAVVAADHTVASLLEPQRAARLVEQHAVDPSLPGLETVIDALLEASFSVDTTDSYHAEVSRAVERVVIDRLMSLARTASMPQVGAVAALRLDQKREALTGSAAAADEADRAHYLAVARDIEHFLTKPAQAAEDASALAAPPGAPIGMPERNWLDRLQPACSESGGF